MGSLGILWLQLCCLLLWQKPGKEQALWHRQQLNKTSLAHAKSIKNRDLARQHSINRKNIKDSNPQEYILIILGSGYLVVQS